MSEDRELHPNLADALEGPEVDAAELEAVARLLADLPSLEAPPAGLFDAIAAEAFGSTSSEPQAEVANAPSAPVAPAPVRPDADVVARRSIGSRGRWPRLAAAAAVVVAAGLVGALVLGGGDDGPDEQRVELAALADFEGADASAVLTVEDGQRVVDVDLHGVELPAGSHLELWLLDPEASQTISLGVLSDPGPFEIPEGVDLAVTPILDVSVEPDDGDAAHSGVSVVRGELPPA
jgi:hypothetical protein